MIKISDKKRHFINFLAVFTIFSIIFLLSKKEFISSYGQGILINIFIGIIMATGLNIATGFLGQITLGHAGFMAIGAYSSSIITIAMKNANILTNTPVENILRFFIGTAFGGILAALFGILVGIPALRLKGDYLAIITASTPVENILRFFIGTAFGGILAALFGILVGIPALRLKGDYLAIITLGFGEIMRVLLQNMEITKKGRTFTGIDNLSNIYVVFWIMVVCVSILYAFVNSKYGRAIIAIREDEIAAGATGLNTTYYKVLAFTLSAFFAGVAGSIYAHHIGTLQPSLASFNKSVEYVAIVVLGGMGSLTGSVIAAILLVSLPEALRAFSDYRMLVYSVALILIMIFKPSGLFGNYEFSLIRLLNKYFLKQDKEEIISQEKGDDNE